MEASETIPPEVRAGVEANALFDAVRRDDYAAAAKAQERLKELSWHITRDGQTKRIKKGLSPFQ